MPPALITLAQATQPSQPPQPAQTKGRADSSAIFLWVAVLIVVIMVGGLFLMWLRRRMMTPEADNTGGLMESLRKMRDAGQMSQEEYDAARKAMAARVAKIDLPKKPAPESR